MTNDRAAHLAAELRAYGDESTQVAVDLLVEACAGRWLRALTRDLAGYVSRTADDGTTVDWDRLGEDLAGGLLVGSSGELQVLAVACSIAGHHALVLGAAFTSLDNDNRAAVGRALRRLL